MDNFSFHIQLYIILIKISIYLLKIVLRYVRIIVEKIERRDPTMNRKRITKINYLLTNTNICSRGGDVSRLISKDFVSDLTNNKDYEITSRNTSLS